MFDTRNNSTDQRSVHLFYNYVAKQTSKIKALSYLTEMYSQTNDSNFISLSYEIQKMLTNKFELKHDQINMIFGDDPNYEIQRKISNDFVDRLDSTRLPIILLNGATLKFETFYEFEESVLSEIMHQTPSLQKEVYRGEIDDAMSVTDYLMSQPHVMPRLSKRILSNDHVNVLDFSGNVTAEKDFNNLNNISRTNAISTFIENLRYFKEISGAEFFLKYQIHFLTIWVVGDLENSSTKQTFFNALTFVQKNTGIRLSFIPNVKNDLASRKKSLNNLVWAALYTLDEHEFLQFVDSILSDKIELEHADIPIKVAEYLDQSLSQIKELRIFCQRIFNLQPAEAALIVNGKVVGPLNNDEILSVDDFGLIKKVTTDFYTNKIKKVIKSLMKQKGKL